MTNSAVRCAYVFDLDGTLCDCSPRAKRYLEDGGQNWEEFYAHCEEDEEISDVCWILRDLGLTCYQPAYGAY